MAKRRNTELTLEFFQEQGRRGGKARTPAKLAAVRRNIAKARAAKKGAK